MRINIKPISANEMWQGKKFKSPKYKAWREEFGYELLRTMDKHHRKEFDCKVAINLRIFCKNADRSDIDNFIKPILDALVENKILKDDRLVNELEVTKHKSEEEYIFLNIKKYSIV